MNYRKLHLLLPALASLGLPLSLQAQDTDETLAFIRDWVGYRVVPEFAPNPNNIEIFPDYCIDFQEDPLVQGGSCANISPYGVEYTEFLSMLETAYNEDRGGVINFENAILGPAYRAPERLAHRAFIEQFILDNPLEEYEAQVRAENPDMNDADVLALSSYIQQLDAYEAAEEALLDETVVIPVVARGDRGLDDTEDRAILEGSIFNDKIIGFYGPEKDTPLVISRGPRSYTEGQLATPNIPAKWDLGGMINGEFFTSVGISSYSGGNAYRPTSGIFTFNSGMHDLVFDARDNVKAVGFAFLTYGNFQYYQGDSGVPVNPNNMRVFVEFSNGETEELAETSRQSSGNWDVFFGIEAPEGASITRVWCRVVGRNWRTFVALDDFAFITEPALSYIVGETNFTGSAGAEFYEILQVGQNPQSVTVSGLPAGLSYDAESGLISGTFTESGSFTATATLVNSVGTAEETLSFEVAPADDPANYLQLDPVEPVNVVLRRELPEVIITSNLDDDLPPGSISYFSLVERILDDGSRVASSLDFLDLTLRDNLLFGTPGSAQQIGVYEVTIFGRTATSASSTGFILTILAPTTTPNFDSNGTSDFALLLDGQLWTAANAADPGSFGQTPLTVSISGISTEASIFIGDFNGDNQSDILEWDASSRMVMAHLFNAETGQFTPTNLTPWGVAEGEDIRQVLDYDGDGSSDVYWRNEEKGRSTIWLMRNGAIAWAGMPDELAGGHGDIVLTGDFAGDGSLIHLYELSTGEYRLEQFNTFTSLAKATSTAVEFSIDPEWRPLLSVDMTNDGRQDIIWENPDTGEVTFWEMEGTTVPASYLTVADDESITGNKGVTLLPTGFDWGVVAAADFNNDQYGDLLLRNRNSGHLGVLYMRAPGSTGPIHIIGSAAEDILAIGDYDGDAQNDLLLTDTATGQLNILSLNADGVESATGYGTNPSGGNWLTGPSVRNDVNPLQFTYDWLGPYTFISPVWAYSSVWGYFSPTGFDAETGEGWLYDPVLGYIWTSSEIFPNYLYQSRNGFWLQFLWSTSNPRTFYNYIFFFYMTEDML